MKPDIKEESTGYIDLSGKVIVSDPCLNRDHLYNTKDITVKPGRYYATVLAGEEKGFGKMVRCIIVIHCDFLHGPRAHMELVSDKIGVDSGQCGIFDDTIYPRTKNSIGEYDDPSAFYDECDKLTRNDKQSGLLENRKGVVSSSGIGNGVYELYCQYHEGERVVLFLNFDPRVKVEDFNSECIKIENARKTSNKPQK